jgi:predicted DNA-binding transcriptional regulator AlpA
MNTPATTQAAEAQPLAVDSFGAARLLGVSESHWRVMLAGGRVPPGFRLGRRRLWAVAELSAWIQAGAPSADRWAILKRA